jgi:hypothetical protein
MNNLKILSIGILFLNYLAVDSARAQNYRSVPCEWNAKKSKDNSPSTEKVKSPKELLKFVSENSNCSLSNVNWKNEWVYLYQLPCPGMNDEFKVRAYKKGALNILQLKPDAKCNSTTVCGSQGIAVILSKKEAIHTVSLEKQTVTCPN